MISNNKTILIITGLTFALVSITFEVLLFIDFAQSTIDKTLAGVTAFALVVCQFAFVGLCIRQWRTNKLFALFIALTILALFSISTTGTAAFFESRFSNDLTIKTQNSESYKMQIENINDLKTQKQMIIETANSAKEKGNNWYAGEQLKSAKGINEKIETLTKTLNETRATPSNAGGALGVLLSQYRWFGWFFIALIIDICPVICFASIASEKDKTEIKTKTKTENAGQSLDCQNQPKEIDWEWAREKNKQIMIDMKLGTITNKTPKGDPQKQTPDAIFIPESLEEHLKNNNLNQTQFCEKHDIKPKHLSLAKNHEKRVNEGKETAPKAVLIKIQSIINKQESNA